eukprot:scaffold35170_cov48-Phaeocystis_antarctica.AAC.2
MHGMVPPPPMARVRVRVGVRVSGAPKQRTCQSASRCGNGGQLEAAPEARARARSSGSCARSRPKSSSSRRCHSPDGWSEAGASRGAGTASGGGGGRLAPSAASVLGPAVAAAGLGGSTLARTTAGIAFDSLRTRRRYSNPSHGGACSFVGSPLTAKAGLRIWSTSSSASSFCAVGPLLKRMFAISRGRSRTRGVCARRRA